MDMVERPNSLARAGGFAAVLLFHAALIYVLVTGLGKEAVQMITAPIETRIITEQQPLPPPPPPPPPPTLTLPPPPFIPLPEIHTELPPPPKAITVPQSPKPPPKQDFKTSTAPTPTQVSPNPAPVAVPSVRTGASRIASAGCDTPEKPAVSERIGEKGTVLIAVEIGPDGHVTGSTVASSSGFKRLDDAGLAAISLCRFRPGTVDGKPEASKANVRYRFE